MEQIKIKVEFKYIVEEIRTKKKGINKNKLYPEVGYIKMTLSEFDKDKFLADTIGKEFTIQEIGCPEHVFKIKDIILHRVIKTTIITEELFHD